ncbi:hypothetical protein MNV49_007336 [Pseudohyphozyma bogoriensis]|nr:hypothetical protein MNV49_007336 [Pseudohyphozyma bogoriensis]
MNGTATATAPADLLVPPQSDVDQLRLKLVNIIDAINSLLAQLHHYSLSTPEPSTAAPGLPPYADLIARFNLILSHAVGLGGLLSQVDQKGNDARKDKWDGSAVKPREVIEENKDWIVGVLLRTKQSPEIESHLVDLLNALPPLYSNPETFSSALASRNEFTAACVTKITELKESLDGEEWDWKGRVELEEDEEEEDGEEGGKKGGEEENMDVDGAGGGGGEEAPKGRPWTIQEVAAYQRTGKLPF